MFRQRPFWLPHPFPKILLGVILSVHFPAFAQANPSVDQVLANYLLAVGGREKIASILAFAEKGELYGNLGGFGHPYARPAQAKQRQTFETYFKAPNLHFSVWLGEDRDVVRMTGCDGSISWYVGRDGIRRDAEPKPGAEYECKTGYEPLPLLSLAPDLKLQLKGRKNFGGRAAWAVRVRDPKSPFTDTYYFDAQTYLLLRWENIESGNGLAVTSRFRSIAPTPITAKSAELSCHS
jgi:hypothetical protein